MTGKSVWMGCAFGLAAFAAKAQQTTIKGVVRSAQVPLRYGVVQIKGAADAAYTDKDGRYSLQTGLRGTVTVNVSLPGYAPQSKTIDLGGEPDFSLNWQLAPASRELGEVIVSASRKPETLDNVPSSVTVVSRKTLEDNMAVTTDLTQILAGAVPGLAPSAQTNSNVGQSLRGARCSL